MEKSELWEKFNNPEYVKNLKNYNTLDPKYIKANKDFINELLPYFKYFVKHEYYNLSYDEIKDIMQDYYLKLTNRLDLFDINRGEFLPWAFKMLRNTCLDYLRMKEKFIPLSDEINLINNRSHNNIEEVNDEISLIENLSNEVHRKVLLTINPRYRQLLLMGALGYTEQQIIEAINAKNIQHLYVLKNRAKESINKTLKKLESNNYEKKTGLNRYFRNGVVK